MPKAAELPIPAYRDVRLPRIGALGAFNVASLFMNNEPGWVYDSSDMSTLFQDSAGTTPVTAVGQPVGLQLDKKQGLVLGPEMWADASATFSGESSRISAGVYRVLSTAGAVSQVAVGGGTPGKAYEVTVTISSITGSLTTDFINTPTWTTTGVKRFIGILVGPNYTFKRSGVMDATISDISVKELAGTHRTQSTAASRPTFARVPVTGRRNILDNTMFAGAGAGTPGTAPTNWSFNSSGGSTTIPSAGVIGFSATGARHIIGQTITLAANQTQTWRTKVVSNPNGLVYVQLFAVVNATGATLTYYANGVVVNQTGYVPQAGDVLSALLVNGVSPSTPTFRIGVGASSAATGSASFTEPQAELGSTDTNYQKVVSLYDITEAGVQTAYGLYYDGVDDFMVTPTITPGTDKVQVFAGVRKVSDAALGSVVGLAQNTLSFDGSFELLTKSDPTYRYLWSSRGTVPKNAFTNNPAYEAPVSNVLTGLGDISGDRATLRINGTQVAQATTDQGTGNYLAYPAYFGRRGGTQSPFIGYTFREIGRFGPNLDAMAISNTEKWINQATGAY